MDYFRKRQIKQELDKFSEQDWADICTRCKSYLEKKLFNKTQYGAHSEKELGLPAIDYYLNESIAKLFAFDWEWKFEKYNIIEQIIRIASSLISKNVDKYRTKKKSEQIKVETEYNDNFTFDIFDEVYDGEIDQILECIERIIKGNDALQILWESTKEGLKSAEIAEIMEKPVKYVYRQNEKLIYHAKTKCLTSEIQ
jgi:hypothetical protein